jgi:hypothetical protein
MCDQQESVKEPQMVSAAGNGQIGAKRLLAWKHESIPFECRTLRRRFYVVEKRLRALWVLRRTEDHGALLNGGVQIVWDLEIAALVF